MKAVFLIALLFIAQILADVYMQNPRGSNDRLNENNENRNNGNRLFDSQNNAKGGYCVGPMMQYYEGSLLSVEWTAQHGCGQNKKVYCNVVVQYMCSSANEPDLLKRVRDGTTTNTIPDNAQQAAGLTNNVPTFGMHESYQWYQDCKARSRNKGLFIADRNLNGNDARYTRQNNNGGRSGFECPEERDYYPYWVASPWKDVAILTSDKEWCDFYQAESQNVKSRFRCETNNGNQATQITEVECTQAGNKWIEQQSWGVAAPACLQAPWQRDNHLGNGNTAESEGGASFNWTLPFSDDEACIGNGDCSCVMRLRYNISTSELSNRPDAGFEDWTSNKGKLVQDEIVAQDNLTHQLAIDTTQFGRTFQDRTHVFTIKKRPDGITRTNRLFNLNVRGKRGNIVQAYPATEYDFVPRHLIGRVGDYVHFQWTGCDTNPAGNAGEGTAATDRSNIVQVADANANKPADDSWIAGNTALFEEKDLRAYMAMLGQTKCKTYEQLKQKNNNNQNNIEQDVENCMKLNAASQYFDGGVVRMNLTGNFFYMSSRNNNFSNRSQKGQIDIDPLLPSWAIAIVVIGAGLFVASAGVAGLMVYAKANPHSSVASVLSRM